MPMFFSVSSESGSMAQAQVYGYVRLFGLELILRIKIRTAITIRVWLGFRLGFGLRLGQEVSLSAAVQRVCICMQAGKFSSGSRRHPRKIHHHPKTQLH